MFCGYSPASEKKNGVRGWTHTHSGKFSRKPQQDPVISSHQDKFNTEKHTGLTHRFYLETRSLEKGHEACPWPPVIRRDSSPCRSYSSCGAHPPPPHPPSKSSLNYEQGKGQYEGSSWRGRAAGNACRLAALGGHWGRGDGRGGGVCNVNGNLRHILDKSWNS